ncbi:hypothetical protein MOSE0_L00320 [Monosporozyma servazzii]
MFWCGKLDFPGKIPMPRLLCSSSSAEFPRIPPFGPHIAFLSALFLRAEYPTTRPSAFTGDNIPGWGAGAPATTATTATAAGPLGQGPRVVPVGRTRLPAAKLAVWSQIFRVQTMGPPVSDAIEGHFFGLSPHYGQRTPPPGFIPLRYSHYPDLLLFTVRAAEMDVSIDRRSRRFIPSSLMRLFVSFFPRNNVSGKNIWTVEVFTKILLCYVYIPVTVSIYSRCVSPYPSLN